MNLFVYFNGATLKYPMNINIFWNEFLLYQKQQWTEYWRFKTNWNGTVKQEKKYKIK